MIEEDLIVLQDETWRWNDGEAVASTPESLRRDVDSDLRLATGADTAQEAYELFVDHAGNA